MKKLLTIFSLMAAAVLLAPADSLDYAYRLPAELQTPGPQSLPELTWQQGSTPLIQVEVLRRGRPVTADTNTTVRMIIGPSSTSHYYVVTEQSVTTGTSYYVQWPTVGTNTMGTNTTPQAWWYTIYFERDGHRYWTGNGDLYIEETTSTDPDGLIWQEIVSGSIAWGHIVGTLGSQSDLQAALDGKVGTTNPTFLTINQSMTNYVHVPSSTNWYAYDPLTRTASGCATNANTAGGGGLWEINLFGGMMPVLTTNQDLIWELVDGNLTPK